MALIPPNPQQRKGSGFTNLSRVLEANKNNQLGSTVAGGLTAGANQVQQGVQQAGQDFRADADKNNLASQANADHRKQAISNIMAGGASSLVNPLDVQQFGDYRAGVYKGPTELDSQKTLQLGGKAKELQGYGADKSQALQAYVAPTGTNYNRGQQRLDGLLLGQSPQKDALMRAGQQTKGLTQNVSSEQNKARALGDMRTAEARQFGTDTGEMLGKETSGLETGISDLVTKYAGEQKDKYDAYKASLTGRQIGKGQTDLEGLRGTSTYGVDPLQERFFNQSNAPTASSVANKTQFAQLNALAQLSGKDQSAFLPTLSENPYDPNKAVSFDKNAYDTARKTEGEAKYQAVMNAPINTQTSGVTDPLIPGGTMQDQVNYINQKDANGQSLADRARAIGDQGTLARINQISAAWGNMMAQYGVNDRFK